MKIRLWEPCCSIALTESEDEVHDWEVEVDETTARRWANVMADYQQVQREMRQAIGDTDRRIEQTLRPGIDAVNRQVPPAPWNGLQRLLKGRDHFDDLVQRLVEEGRRTGHTPHCADSAAEDRAYEILNRGWPNPRYPRACGLATAQTAQKAPE